MPTRHIAFLAALLLAPAAVAAQALEFPSLPAEAPAGTGKVEPCDAEGLVGNARCGVYRVWEDRERREGRTVDIAFVVLEALELEARLDDPIVLLPGGPGQAFTPGAVRISRGFDGHGVGGPCVQRMVVALIESGSLEGVDTSCVERAGRG